MATTAQTRDGDRVVDSHPLAAELAKVLPKDRKFTAYHLSTPPTIADPLCLPPAYNNTSSDSKDRRPSKPLKTYCEKHFLAISIGAGKEEAHREKEILVLGLEIYIYTTSFSTIIFVSKADSTGYLNLLNLPKGTPSPIREITSCFLAFLVANRRRQSKQLVVNLFARAQSQYLFAGSVKNNGKHILDDRGLVKWWCRVLNTLLEGADYEDVRKPWESMHGYLVIPGLDNYETRAFLPRTSLATSNWTLNHPLEKISPYTNDPDSFGTNVHPRSLIPMYPDDPKARFVQELEESTAEKAKLLNGWKTPKTLDQFWEMMAFRQECSSGRLTGFLWVVFEPKADSKPSSSTAKPAATIPTPNASFSTTTDDVTPPTTPRPTQRGNTSLTTPGASSSKLNGLRTRKLRRKHKAKKVLSGPIIPRKPQIKTRQREFPKLVETPYYFWPKNGRGQVVLNDNSYKRAIELLLHLEFGTLEQGVLSTARWTREVNMGENWALEIVGERAAVDSTASSSSTEETVNNLSGVVRKKRSADEATSESVLSSPAVNTLGDSLIRKKAKLDASTTTTSVGPEAESEPKANVLGAGLVRKKPKA
ncbi:histone acetylation protein-domain-containing protein [Daldinia caldariorum]|uniref:histone acetylation protein-domain-containing protein n=1 Tax=Daldinia caldariorum TaxID=326644 RepID=UPI002007E544|nr:histone acetylation protein-domain-containing protein [Daldinia caldariorum]KAI1464480.1 histone acetylation protein-domain-containing protein [Daldinia caldariorum]